MKFKHKCECSGCNKSGTVKLKNNHYVCDEHYKILKHNRKVKKHNVFFKSIFIGDLGNSIQIYKDIMIKY
jgi:hypothetical protein